MVDSIFDLRNVSYTYLRRFEALKEVNLTINAGEQVAILGANGSGKSTLLAILNALNYPTSGEFYAFGNPVKEELFDTLEDNEFNRFFRKKVGFLFQNPDVQLFSSTVYDEIAFGPLQLDLPTGGCQKKNRGYHQHAGDRKPCRPCTPHVKRRREKESLYRVDFIHESGCPAA